MAFESYTNFADMFNGGGAGVSGSEFEGGGILSALANSIFSPFGSQAPDEHQHTRPQARPLAAPVVSGQGAPQYSGRGDYGMSAPQTPNQIDPSNFRAYGTGQPLMSDVNAAGMPSPPMNYGTGRGSVGMPIENLANRTPEEIQLIEYLRSRGQI